MKNRIKKMTKFVNLMTGTNVIGITIAPFGIYLNEKYLNDEIVINHEQIHYEQQKELLIVFFFVIYFIEWLLKFFIFGKRAYYYISFEKEANKYENEPDYYLKRNRYAWLKEIL